MGYMARLAALVVAATLITGCATSTSSSSGSGSDGVTKGSIKIGGLLTKTSPVGRIIADGPPAQVRTDPAVRSAYLG